MSVSEETGQVEADLITIAELARRWHTTAQGIYAARHRGTGPRAIRVGRRLLFRLSDVLAWEERRAEPEPPRQITGPAPRRHSRALPSIPLSRVPEDPRP